MTEVAFVGMGGVASAVAAHLWQGGIQDMRLCSRRPFTALVVDEPRRRIRVPIAATLDPANVEPAKWVFVGTKAQQTPGAAAWLSALCDSDSRVVVLQNGVEQRERLTPYVRGAAVIPAVVYCPAEMLSPGSVRVLGATSLTVADDEHGRALQSLTQSSDMAINLSEDITRALWGKLCVNAVVAPITALTGKPLGVFHVPEIESFAYALLEEVVAVAEAEGAHLTKEMVTHAVTRSQAAPRVQKPSTLQDRLAGRELEYDALNGAVVRLGQKHGIATPLNAAMVALMKATSANVEAAEPSA